MLEAREVRKDLACTVTPDKPELGSIFASTADIDVSVPSERAGGNENQLTILFRVTPDNA